MTLRELRKELQGLKPDAQVVFVFEDMPVKDWEFDGAIERNPLDDNRQQHPHVVIQFRRVDDGK